MKARTFYSVAVIAAGSFLSQSDAEAGNFCHPGYYQPSYHQASHYQTVYYYRTGYYEPRYGQPTYYYYQPGYSQPSYQSPCQPVPQYRTVPRTVTTVEARLQALEGLSGDHEGRIQTLETNTPQR